MDPCERLAQALQDAIDANGGAVPSMGQLFQIIQSGIGCTVTTIRQVGGQIVIGTTGGDIVIEDDPTTTTTTTTTSHAKQGVPWAELAAGFLLFKAVQS